MKTNVREWFSKAISDRCKRAGGLRLAEARSGPRVCDPQQASLYGRWTLLLTDGPIRTGLTLLPAILLSVAVHAAEPPSSSSTAPVAADDAAELAKKLSNPVAALISVPFQNNFDFGAGPNDDGFPYTLNFQPTVPVLQQRHRAQRTLPRIEGAEV